MGKILLIWGDEERHTKKFSLIQAQFTCLEFSTFFTCILWWLWQKTVMIVKTSLLQTSEKNGQPRHRMDKRVSSLNMGTITVNVFPMFFFCAKQWQLVRTLHACISHLYRSCHRFFQRQNKTTELQHNNGAFTCKKSSSSCQRGTQTNTLACAHCRMMDWPSLFHQRPKKDAITYHSSGTRNQPPRLSSSATSRKESSPFHPLPLTVGKRFYGFLCFSVLARNILDGATKTPIDVLTQMKRPKTVPFCFPQASTKTEFFSSVVNDKLFRLKVKFRGEKQRYKSPPKSSTGIRK